MYGADMPLVGFSRNLSAKSLICIDLDLSRVLALLYLDLSKIMMRRFFEPPEAVMILARVSSDSQQVLLREVAHLLTSPVVQMDALRFDLNTKICAAHTLPFPSCWRIAHARSNMSNAYGTSQSFKW